MEKTLIKISLILGYCVPYVFLAMNEDAITGTPYFYFVMILCFSVLCFFSIKTNNKKIALSGNVLSFISSCVFALLFKTEKWEYYFKPFLPNQLIIFETVIILAVHLIIFIKKRSSEK
jgi:membrane associated rhomboid family serine protease